MGFLTRSLKGISAKLRKRKYSKKQLIKLYIVKSGNPIKKIIRIKNRKKLKIALNKLTKKEITLLIKCDGLI